MKQFIKLTFTRTGKPYRVDPEIIAEIFVEENDQAFVTITNCDKCVKVRETPEEILALIAKAQGEVTVNLHDLAAGKYRAGTIRGDKNEVK